MVVVFDSEDFLVPKFVKNKLVVGLFEGDGVVLVFFLDIEQVHCSQLNVVILTV